MQRFTWLMGGALSLLLLLGITSTTFADGWRAVAHPVSAWRGTLLPRLGVDAPREVLRGERATVTLVAPGRERVTLHRRATVAETKGVERYPVQRPIRHHDQPGDARRDR